MLEVKGKDISEIKLPEAQGFREIKPQNKMNASEAKRFWDSKFESNKDGQQTDVGRDKQGNRAEMRNSNEADNAFKDESIEEVKEGGSYREVKAHSDGTTHEVHHMPSDSVSPLDRMDGPAIKMEKEDHRQTASCGSSIEAREYQAAQREKILNGDFRGALQMDIEDIRDKFGNKYDKAIDQMLRYVDCLESEGKLQCN